MSREDREAVFDSGIDETLKEDCLEIEKKDKVYFLEIETDKNQVYFLIQSVPSKSPTQIIKMLKSTATNEIFRIHPDVKTQLWVANFWADGYFVKTVSKVGDDLGYLKMSENKELKTILLFCTVQIIWICLQILHS